MPFLDTSLLMSRIHLADRYDAVVPVVDGRSQTLHAIYAQTCVPFPRDLMGQEHSGLRDLCAALNVRYVDGSELEGLDRWRRPCLNINTQEDLRVC